MIAGCPTCAARYRIDTAKLGPDGARLRCSRCETVFRVRPPEAAAQAPAEAPAPARRPAPPQASTPPASRPAPAARGAARAPRPGDEGPALDPARLVVIAHPEPDSGKEIADAVSSWGLSALLVHDGVEAILQIQRTLPRVVVLDAALPKMFGFQVCELMKRNEQLRTIPVVLIGAIHDRDRYRRRPEELYGADAYAERHELPDALAPMLQRFGMTPSGVAQAPPVPKAAAPAPAPPAPAPPVAAAPAPTPPAPPKPRPAAAPAAAPRAAATPQAAPAAASGGGDPETEKGLRLARIIVSDVILYNPEKFEAGVQAGNVVEALATELEEGFGLFAQRVDTRVCDPREFLERELVCVARSRGMS